MVEDGKDCLAPVDREDGLEHGPVELIDASFELLCQLLQPVDVHRRVRPENALELLLHLRRLCKLFLLL